MSVLMYKYAALDASGASTSGTIRAADEQEAYRKISASGLTPLNLEEVKEAKPFFSFGKVTQKDIVGFTRELAVLIEARIPLDRGLISIAEQEPKRELASMIRDIATTVESGSPMTVALERYRGTFGDVYIESMRAAEKSGSLQEVTTHLAEMLERSMETNQMMKRAAAYPVIVLTMVSVALTVIVGFVVPNFAKTFESQKVALPLPTRIIQGIGFSVQSYWYLYAAVVAGCIVGLIMTWRSPDGRLKMEAILARTPYIGKMIVSVCAARFARVLGIGLMSGLDIIDALEVAGRATARPVFVLECMEMAAKLRQGERLTDVIHTTRYLPNFAKRMLGAGKDSKEVARACDIVARYYDRESNHLTKNINTIIEPLLTVALAGIVLIVALAVFLPMWQMSSIKH
jgi:type II secretory pathway component PulF